MSVVLSEHLPLLASAPDGIAKLRGLILELAVRGKLVPQDSTDESASELLTRITQERTRLEAEGVCKKSKATPLEGADGQPFELPQNWTWTNLATVALINPRNAAADSIEASFVPMAMIGSRFEGSHQQEFRKWGEVKQGFTHFAEGDIGVAKITPCFENSKACVFSGLKNGIGAGTTELHVVRPIGQTLSPRYVLAYLKAPMFLLVGETKMTGTAGQKRLPKDFLEANPFPLPPLAEQHRIVAKVDELMALCDRLEAEQADAVSAHARLVETLLGTLTQSTDTADLAASWQRLAKRFDTLFTTEASIDALKQIVLQLAVMGKLVPQNFAHEPARELLNRIQKEFVTADAAVRVRKAKPLPPVCDEEKPFEAPTNWEWIRLQDIMSVSSGDGLTSEKMAKAGDVPVYGGNGVTGRHDQANIDKPTLVIGRVGFYCGSIHLTPAKAWVTDNALKVRFSEKNLSIEFLFWLLKATNLKGNESATAQPLVSGKTIYPIVVALPPLAEQHRIVVKVDELMALCDRLKADLATARQRQATLADTLIESALEAA